MNDNFLNINIPIVNIQHILTVSSFDIHVHVYYNTYQDHSADCVLTERDKEVYYHQTG